MTLRNPPSNLPNSFSPVRKSGPLPRLITRWLHTELRTNWLTSFEVATDSGQRAAAQTARVRSLIAESVEVKQALAESAADEIARAAQLLARSFEQGGKVLIFGNGGSAADAQHIADELVNRMRRDRPALPAIALAANSSDVTAIANDFGFERVFARLVEAHGRTGDVALALSTSGNSPNVIEGAKCARDRGLVTVALVGRDGGKLAKVVDLAIAVPSTDTARIQESHMTIGHILCELVDDLLFPETLAT